MGPRVADLDTDVEGEGTRRAGIAVLSPSSRMGALFSRNPWTRARQPGAWGVWARGLHPGPPRHLREASRQEM